MFNETQGPELLTEDQFVEWYVTMYPGTMQHLRLGYFYDKMASSEIIAQNFLSWPVALQIATVEYIEIGQAGSIVGLNSDLRLRLYDKYPPYRLPYERVNSTKKRSINWLIATPIEISGEVERSSNIRDIERFKNSMSQIHHVIHTNGHPLSGLIEIVPYFLTRLYDGDTIAILISKLKILQLSVSLSMFVKLVENFDQTETYPIEWVISMLDDA